MNFSFGFGNNYYNNRNIAYYKGGPVSSIVMGIIIILIGIVIMFFSFSSKKDYNKKNSTYIEANATIVDVLSRNRSDRNADTGMIEEYTEYAPVLEYKVNENTYRYNGDYSTTRVVKDQQVKIKYNPKNPNDIIMVNSKNYMILLIIGAVFIIVGLISLVYGVTKIYSNKNENPKIDSNNSNNIDTNMQENTEVQNSNIQGSKDLNNNTENVQTISNINSTQNNNQDSLNDLYKRN